MDTVQKIEPWRPMNSSLEGNEKNWADCNANIEQFSHELEGDYQSEISHLSLFLDAFYGYLGVRRSEWFNRSLNRVAQFMYGLKCSSTSVHDIKGEVSAFLKNVNAKRDLIKVISNSLEDQSSLNCIAEQLNTQLTSLKERVISANSLRTDMRMLNDIKTNFSQLKDTLSRNDDLLKHSLSIAKEDDCSAKLPDLKILKMEVERLADQRLILIDKLLHFANLPLDTNAVKSQLMDLRSQLTNFDDQLMKQYDFRVWQ